MKKRVPERCVVAAMAFVLGLGLAAQAEQLPWSEVQAPLYAVLEHSWYSPYPALNDRQGIWAWHPEANTWRRVAPFVYNTQGSGSHDKRAVTAYLTTTWDHLLFEGGGVRFHLDPGSGRILRRFSPTVAEAPSGWPWEAKGPCLGALPGESATTPVLIGFPVRGGLLPFTAEVAFPRLYREQACGGPVTLLADFSDLPESEFHHFHRNLNYDPQRGGFWILGVRGSSSSDHETLQVSFFPFANGEVNLAGAVRSQIPHPLQKGSFNFSFLDLERGVFFARSVDDSYAAHMLKIDPATWSAESLWSAPIYGKGEGPIPHTLTRLPRELPGTYEQTIPIIVRAAGRGGTQWSSDLWLFNPSGEPTEVTLRRVVKPEVSKVVELPAHGSVKIPDVLAWLGGGTGGDGVTHDAVVISSPYRWGEQLVAASRVWTPSLDPDERSRGGSMGQAVPAVPGTTGYSNHLRTADDGTPRTEAEIHTGKTAIWVLDHREPGRFRHNAGFVNDRDHEVIITLWWGWSNCIPVPYTSEWPAGGARQDLALPPHSVTMVNLESLFPESIRQAYPSQLGVTGTYPVALWLSQVDNRTGDGIHVPYTLYWTSADAESSVAIPAVAHLPGAAGTVWSSDLYLPAAEEYHLFSPFDEPDAAFRPAWRERCGGTSSITAPLDGVPPSDPTIKHPYWPLWWRAIFPDVVRLFPACAEENNVRGALEVRTASWMAGYARTYTTRADGGTYGEMLPFYPLYGWPVQHFAGLEVSPRFRLNLGLYNGNKDHAIVHRLTLYNEGGSKVAEKELTLQPRANLVERLEDLLGIPRDSLPAGSYGLTVLPLDVADAGVQGRSWAFVSVVDNVTGDPTNWW